jgi:hypothetical protein
MVSNLKREWGMGNWELGKPVFIPPLCATAHGSLLSGRIALRPYHAWVAS